MTAQVRAAHVHDVDAVIALWEIAGENAARPVDTPEAIQGLLRRDDGALLLAILDDAVIGTVIAGWDGWRAHLYRLAVHPEHRGRGVARMLLDAAEERLHSCGARRFDAMVLDENAGGAKFWSARGYARQTEWARWVRPTSH